MLLVVRLFKGWIGIFFTILLVILALIGFSVKCLLVARIQIDLMVFVVRFKLAGFLRVHQPLQYLLVTVRTSKIVVEHFQIYLHKLRGGIRGCECG